MAAPKKPGRLARKRQQRRQWDGPPVRSAAIAAPTPAAADATVREAHAERPVVPVDGTLEPAIGIEPTDFIEPADLVEPADGAAADAKPDRDPAACIAPTGGEAERAEECRERVQETGQAIAAAPVETVRRSDGPTSSREAVARVAEAPDGAAVAAAPFSADAGKPQRWTGRSALAASLVVVMVGAMLALRPTEVPAPSSAAPALASGLDRADHGSQASRSWSDLPRPARAATAPAPVTPAAGPQPVASAEGPALAQDSPLRSVAAASPAHRPGEDVVVAATALIAPAEPPSADSARTPLASITVPLPPRRPASFLVQKPRSVAALPSSQKPAEAIAAAADVTDAEDYSGFAAREHKPGLYRIRWGVARLHENANDDRARGPTWDFPPNP